MQENGKSKTLLCIEMLGLMSDGRIWKIAELADELQTNPRNIVAYRQELEMYGGYNFAYVPGKNGGIRLIKDKLLPVLKFTEEEKKTLLVASDYLKSRPGIVDYDLYQKAMAKVFSSINVVPETEETFIIPGSSLVMSNEDFHKRYSALKAFLEECK
jgi:predicted DNA-binding transcriptional regulator YafY